jgi:hypothetical protein
LTLFVVVLESIKFLEVIFMPIKNLTVRFDDELRASVSLIAEREFRPVSSQIAAFVRQGVDNYFKEHNLMVQEDESYDENGELQIGYFLESRSPS